MKWNVSQDEPLLDMGRIRKVVSGLSDNDSLVVRSYWTLHLIFGGGGCCKRQNLLVLQSKFIYGGDRIYFVLSTKKNTNGLGKYQWDRY